ncbi:MAG: hypothetical protein ORO03_02760 [Alphaproteobacteria bacterium]|nr:hypothetical protein [Alphaproteobacteria bacterium]
MARFKPYADIASMVVCSAALLSFLAVNPLDLQAAEAPPVISFDGQSAAGDEPAPASSVRTAASGVRQVQLHLDGGFGENAEKRVSPLFGAALGVSLSENLAIDFDMRYRAHTGDSYLNGSYSNLSLSPMLRTSYELWDGLFFHNLFGIGLGITTMSEDSRTGAGRKTTVSPIWTLGVGLEKRYTETIGYSVDMRLNHLGYRKDYFFALPDSLDVTVGVSFTF